MKKTVLTFIAIGFGMSVAFGQSSALAQEEVQKEKMLNTDFSLHTGNEDSRLEMHDLPDETRHAFKNGKYSGFQVLKITKKRSEAGAPVVYEFELARASVTKSEGASGVEVEKLSNRRPEFLVYIDENGKVVKERSLYDINKPKKS